MHKPQVKKIKKALEIIKLKINWQKRSRVYIGILILLIIFLAIFSVAKFNKKISDQKVQTRLSEIREEIEINEPIENVLDITDDLKFIEENEKSIQDTDVTLVKGILHLQLADYYFEKQDYNSACDSIISYLDLVKKYPDDGLQTILNPKLSLETTMNAARSVDKCNNEEVINEVLEISQISRFKFQDKLILTYYDNLIVEENYQWIADTFSKSIDEVKLNDEKHRDAIRILIFDTKTLTPKFYKQYRSDENTKSYFGLQNEPFGLNNDKLIWKHSGSVVLNLSEIK